LLETPYGSRKGHRNPRLLEIEIESDGTNAGTKILLNGKKIVGLASLAFNFYNSDYSPVNLGYRVEDGKYEAGTLQSSTYFSLIPPKAKAADGSAQAVASVGGPVSSFNPLR